MAITSRRIQATPDQVWDVLADGWIYPLWVVGASRMRDVDATWPAAGSRLHHSVGTWPLLVDDRTQVVESVPGSVLVLHARALPAGTAGVTVRLEPVGADTEVSIEEDLIRGPGRLVPKLLRDPSIDWRNRESLRRLAFVVERRRASSAGNSGH